MFFDYYVTQPSPAIYRNCTTKKNNAAVNKTAKKKRQQTKNQEN